MKKSLIILVVILVLAAVLRFYKLSIYPPGLYIDEVSIGYNAYSILKKGVDQYGVKYPLWFKAYGEYKLPGYIYLTSLSMAVFGKSIFAVRFPSAVLGVATILIFYLFIKELFAKQFQQQSKHLGLISAFLLAISSWHLQLSRAGFEVNVGLFFFVLGCWQALKYYKQKKIGQILLSYLSFVLTFYIYNSFRIISPIVLAGLSIFFFTKFEKKRKQLLPIYFVFFLLSIPMMSFSLSSKGAERFSQISAFNKKGVDTTLEKITSYPLIYLINFILHFGTNFLFNYGDGIKRHVMKDFGMLSRWQLPLLIFGFVGVFKNRDKLWGKVLIILALLAPLASSLTTPSPHGLRSYLLVVPLTAIVSFGIFTLYKKLKGRSRWLVIVLISLVGLYEFIFHQHFYYVHYPQLRVLDWGAGYKQTVEKATELSSNYDKIIVNSTVGGELYFEFYNDELNAEFVDPGWNKPEELDDKKVLYITGSVEEPSDKMIEMIYFPHQLNQDVFATFWEI